MKLIENYFEDASFYKPTGDGLLVIIPYEEKTLQPTARKTINSCLRAIKEFPSFCKADPMINFCTPDKIGIGISRGTACRLVSKNKTLDYSGRILNLASRLMDLARPTGIVLDSDFGINLLTDTKRKLFKADNVFIKGIAEQEAIRIFHTKDKTKISHINKHPMDKADWRKITETRTLRELNKLGSYFVYMLECEVLNPDEIFVEFSFPTIEDGKRIRDVLGLYPYANAKYFVEAGKPKLRVNYDEISKNISARGVTNNMKITLNITYPAKQSMDK